MNLTNEKTTLYQFKLLPDHDQYNLVFIKREFIIKREEEGNRFALYALYKFFVEITYDVANNKIMDKRSFIDGGILNKYTNLPNEF